tara:strand:- start:499 stop:660 length:162 start_codon:yes stop_codon:yes gene_type:complete
MIELFNMFWASPIELRCILLAGIIAFVLVAYLGIKGTEEAIEFQNQKWRERNK